MRESSARVSRVIKSVNNGISIFVDHLRKFPSSGRSGLHDTKKIIDNWEENIKHFVQICPIEMLDKIDHPVSITKDEKKVG